MGLWLKSLESCMFNDVLTLEILSILMWVLKHLWCKNSNYFGSRPFLKFAASEYCGNSRKHYSYFTKISLHRIKLDDFLILFFYNFIILFVGTIVNEFIDPVKISSNSGVNCGLFTIALSNTIRYDTNDLHLSRYLVQCH